MINISIKSIGKDNTEKGKALEREVGNILNILGYKDLLFDIHAIGEEIDISAIHRFSNAPLKVQCKATSRPQDTPSLRLFFGDIEKEKLRARNEGFQGLFVSISGFTSTAQKWYNDLTSEVKSYFWLMKGEQFLEELVNQSRINSPVEIRGKMRFLTAMEILKLELIITLERGMFWWAITKETPSGTTYVIILTALGNSATDLEINYILERNSLPPNQKIIFPRERHAVIETLYDCQPKEIKEIAEKIKESENDVQAIIDELIAQSLIEEKNGKFQIRKEQDVIVTIVREVKATDSFKKLMLSQFYDEIINQIPLFSEIKYGITLEESDRKLLDMMLKTSPGVLEFCILGDSTPFQRPKHQIEKSMLSEEEKNKLFQQNKQHFFMQLSELLNNDYNFLGRSNIADLLGRLSIYRVKLFNHLTFTNQQSPILDLAWQNILAIGNIQGPLEKGDLIGSTDPDWYLCQANCAYSLGELAEAKKLYEFLYDLVDQKDDRIIYQKAALMGISRCQYYYPSSLGGSFEDSCIKLTDEGLMDEKEVTDFKSSLASSTYKPVPLYFEYR